MQKPPAGKLEIMAVETDKVLAQKATETDKIFRRSEPDDSSGKFDDAEEEDQSSHQTYDCVLEYPIPFWIQVRLSAASDRSRNSSLRQYHQQAHAHVHARATDRPENFFPSTPEYDGPSSEEQTQLLQESMQRYKASKLSSKQPSSTTVDSEASPGERSPPKSVPAFSSEPYGSGNAEYQALIPRCRITKSDIVLGRGGMTNDHPGNIRYRRLVQDNRSFYQRLRKHFKLDHSRKITEALIDGGARFLRRVPIEMGKDHYEIVSFEEARAKVSQALREKPKVQHSKQLRKAYFPGVPSL